MRQVLEAKLEVIAQEFGVDKAADVMDSVEADRSSTSCSCMVCRTRMPSNRSATRWCRSCESTWRSRRRTAICSPQSTIWTPTMPASGATTGAVLAGARHHQLGCCRGGSARKLANAWRVKWADGSESAQACFDARTADENPELEWVTMEDPRARAVISELPRFVAGQPLPVIRVTGLPDSVAASGRCGNQPGG